MNALRHVKGEEFKDDFRSALPRELVARLTHRGLGFFHHPVLHIAYLRAGACSGGLLIPLSNRGSAAGGG